MKWILIITLLICIVLCLDSQAFEGGATNANSHTDNATVPLFFSAEAAKEAVSPPMDAAVQAKAQSMKLTILKQDSGKNFSRMNFTMYSPTDNSGIANQSIGEVVKFVVPSTGWVLRSLQIVGWSGFNQSTKSSPQDKNFLIEVRDKDTNLLYKFADTQNAYFASSAGPVILTLDLPAMRMDESFYVVIYTRGSMYLGAELDNGSGNSYFIFNGKLVPAEFKINGADETRKINWLVRAIGG